MFYSFHVKSTAIWHYSIGLLMTDLATSCCLLHDQLTVARHWCSPTILNLSFFVNQTVLKEIKSNQAVQRICDWTGLIIKSAISKRYKRHFMRIWWIISINQVFVFSMNIWLITCLLFYCIFSCSSVFMHGKNTSVSFSNESEFFGLRFGFVA